MAHTCDLTAQAVRVWWHQPSISGRGRWIQVASSRPVIIVISRLAWEHMKPSSNRKQKQNKKDKNPHPRLPGAVSEEQQGRSQTVEEIDGREAHIVYRPWNRVRHCQGPHSALCTGLLSSRSTEQLCVAPGRPRWRECGHHPWVLEMPACIFFILTGQTDRKVSRRKTWLHSLAF